MSFHLARLRSPTSMPANLDEQSELLVAAVRSAIERAANEQTLRHEAEKALEGACRRLQLPWTPIVLDRSLGGQGPARFADVVHGAVLIEYEAPRSFRGRDGARLRHACAQAQEYAELLSREEGRPIGDYVLVVWDGAHISFGVHDGRASRWEALEPFGAASARRLLECLRRDGVPLVHPLLLSHLVGPSSAVGARLLPALYRAVRSAAGSATKTHLLFTEWRRLFGQVVGAPSERLKRHLTTLSDAHSEPYAEDPPAYLFALNTQIAFVAKLVAAMALPDAAEDIADPTTPIRRRLAQLESGQLFHDAGVVNMLSGDFFSWYVDDPAWVTYEDALRDTLDRLRGVSFDVARKSAASTRDLFKGIYMTFAPRALRHALGEYYTPDWLAAHVLDTVAWRPDQSLLDPTCGSGTFLLEAVRRRLAAAPEADAAALLAGIYGLDLNPLAVLVAKASLIVLLGDRFSAERPLRLPIYLADAVNPVAALEDRYEHTLQTELGLRTFALGASIVEHPSYFQLMQRMREQIDRDAPPGEVVAAVGDEPAVRSVPDAERETLEGTAATLIELHEHGWNGIWCAVLADRFAAGAIPPVDVVVGNPPWVKWSHLPSEYATFVKPRCLELGVFSDDVWVGGIESDISTVITYAALRRFCARGGALAFLITGTVFANESSQGFRRWRLPRPEAPARGGEPFEVVLVEDYAAVAPFEGVSNHATLLMVRRSGKPTRYPVPYRIWQPPSEDGRVKRWFSDAETFRREASTVELKGRPVPGTDAGPWLKGSPKQHAVWRRLFGPHAGAYRARKGVTTDANGIFFVRVAPAASGCVKITNEPSNGRRALQQVRNAVVEDVHVFPLLRGEGVAAFRARPDPTYRILVPQRGMHGDPDLPISAPRTHRFLRRFEPVLASRSSYRRFQRGRPFWSLWSTGAYTFSPWKVLWREMPGGTFAAAYVGRWTDPVLGRKVVVPDHKVYFVPCDREEEAAYLTGFLNAPVIATAIAAYAAQLSLGVSVVEYLEIPPFDPGEPSHTDLAQLAREITAAGRPEAEQLVDLDELVAAIVGLPSAARRRRRSPT